MDIIVCGNEVLTTPTPFDVPVELLMRTSGGSHEINRLRYIPMFTLAHNLAVTHPDCVVNSYTFHSDSSCNVPFVHPHIGPGNTNGQGWSRIFVDIRNGIPLTNVYVKATTNGGVTACSQPIPIEVCGHETVTRVNWTPQVFKYLRSNVTSTVATPIDVSTFFGIYDSTNCPITSYPVKIQPVADTRLPFYAVGLQVLPTSNLLQIDLSNPINQTFFVLGQTASGEFNFFEVDVEVCGLETIGIVNPALGNSHLLELGDSIQPINFKDQFTTNSTFCPVYYEIVSNATGSLLSYSDPRISINSTGFLTVNTLTPIPFVELFVRAFTQGIEFALKEFDIEVCGSEFVYLTMPGTNSSLTLEFS